MQIHHIMTTKPHMIAPTATLLDAAQKMQLFGCGILPVGDAYNVVGVLTDRDIVTRGIAFERDSKTTLVKDIMTPNPFFCVEEDHLHTAIHQMNECRTRRVLVKNKNNNLVGIISLGDIIKRVQDKELLCKLFAEASMV